MNDTVFNSVLSNYSQNFPSHVILGGFSTDKTLFPELYYLFNTIRDLKSKTVQNLNKVLLLVDPYFKGEGVNYPEYGLEAYDWSFNDTINSMVYKKIAVQLTDVKISRDLAYSYTTRKEELLLGLREADFADIDTKNFADVIAKIKQSVDKELGTGNKLKLNSGLLHIKRQILLTVKYLTIIDEYLANTKSLNNEVVHQLESILDSISTQLESSELFEGVSQEFKQNQIIESLTNLLNLQIGITEKINQFNI